jgi:adenylate cyclase
MGHFPGGSSPDDDCVVFEGSLAFDCNSDADFNARLYNSDGDAAEGRMAKSGLRWWLVRGTLVSILLNVAGATVTYVYFAYVETGLTDVLHRDSLVGSPIFFAAVMILITGITAGLTARLTIPLWSALDRQPLETQGPDRQRELLGRVMNLPLVAAGTSLAGWGTAGLIYAVALLFGLSGQGSQSLEAFRVFFGIIFVGAPYTVVSLYFVIEWEIRGWLVKTFSPEFLQIAPLAARIGVLPKMLIVSLMIGTVPVCTISVVTLLQITGVQNGTQSIPSFLSHMPEVIAFLLILAVAVGVMLSVFVARSVSMPLHGFGEAMERIRQGDLDVKIPVVANDEIGFMSEGFNRMVDGLKERDFIRETFGSYVSPEVAAEILCSTNGMHLGGELRDITILVADLRGFTPLSAAVGPSVVISILNLYLETMVHIIRDHDGTIDEFTGDGVLAFFGAPRQIGDSSLRAVHCALAMQRAMPSLNSRLEALLPHLGGSDHYPNEAPRTALPLEMGIAINSGTLIVGNIGCNERKKYGAVGSPINLAFRMEKVSGRGEIVISHEVYERVAKEVQVAPLGDVELAGIRGGVTLYRVLGS